MLLYTFCCWCNSSKSVGHKNKIKSKQETVIFLLLAWIDWDQIAVRFITLETCDANYQPFDPKINESLAVLLERVVKKW